MPVKTKTNYKGSGLTYQQWYYRNKKKNGQKGIPDLGSPLDPNAAINTLARDTVLLEEFLSRFEMKSNHHSGSAMGITFGMASALYNTLRHDGH